MLIYDTILGVNVKYKHSQYSHSSIYDHMQNKQNREMLPLVSCTSTLA